jgi:hypothetical protein
MITVELWHKQDLPSNLVLRNLEAAQLTAPPLNLNTTHTHVSDMSFFEDRLINDTKESALNTPKPILWLHACHMVLKITQNNEWLAGVRETAVGDIYVIKHPTCLAGIAMYIQDLTKIRLISNN